MAATAVLAVAPSALAQTPSGPDAAPSGSALRPDPAPTTTHPAVRPSAVQRAIAPRPAARRPSTTHRRAPRKATRHEARATATARPLPQLTPAKLVAPSHDRDARSVAIGGLALLLLALASATLLAFTARVDRERVAR